MIDLTRRAAVAGLAAAAWGASRAATPRPGFADADYARAIVIDGLGGFDDPYAKPGDIRFSARAVAEIRRSGLTAANWTVNEVGNGPGVWDKTVANIAGIGRMVAGNRDLFLPVATAADIVAAKASRRVGVIMGVQDTSLIGADLDRLAALKGLGVRIVQLTYNLRNLSGDGSLEADNGGLSKLGYQTVARIEAERLLLDLSHGGQRTIAEALAAATRPPIISHTGARALNDNPRNVRDAELKLCADKGGVVGVYWMNFLTANGHPTVADLVRHMAHVRDLCGVDHVAIGTDGGLFRTVLDAKYREAWRKEAAERTRLGIAAPGEGPEVFDVIDDLNDELRFRHLADALARAGWTSSQVEKALGLNLLRLYGDVWG